MGRTEWDKSVSKLLSPHSKYYYCSEVLRPEFIESKDRWNPKDRGHKIIVSTISSPLYKGGDVILTTAQLLKNAKIDFEWSVIGASNFKSIEQKIGIMAKDVNVILNGTLSAKVLKERLLNADVFVHPSYIDNSPNSICEAQFLGLPVISTNVGGISSLIPSDDYGLLFPANDPYRACSLIMSILNNKKLSLKISANSRSLAEKRHDQTTIISDLITTYKRITDNEC
jgi:glycosyltransferase involved in cell wall biosynthesis